MKKKTYRKTVRRKEALQEAVLRQELNGFFTNNTDGNLRLAVVAFLILALTYALWQRGFFNF